MTGVQTCALPIFDRARRLRGRYSHAHISGNEHCGTYRPVSTSLERCVGTRFCAKRDQRHLSAPQLARPLPLLADPFPGRPVRGRNSSEPAEMCGVPIAVDLTPHGLRHSHRTNLEEAGIRPVLIDERIGHDDGSVRRCYTHITQAMRDGGAAGPAAGKGKGTISRSSHRIPTERRFRPPPSTPKGPACCVGTEIGRAHV